MKSSYYFWTDISPKWRERKFRVVSLVIFIVLWYVLSLWIRELPTPVETATTFYQLITVGEPILGRTLQEHTLASIKIVLKGFIIGTVIAIPLGIIIGRYKLAENLLNFIVETFRPIPPLAWIPLGFVLFRGLKETGWFQIISHLLGLGTSVAAMVQVFVVFVGAFFPILLNTIQGVKAVNPIYIDVARTFGATEREIVWKIVIPASFPNIITGIRVGLGVGWMCVVAAEMIGGSSSGVGLFIWDMYSIGGGSAEIVCGMIAIGLVGYIMNEVLLFVQRRVFKWS
jgi:NitT/TauT family transport system permease protein